MLKKLCLITAAICIVTGLTGCTPKEKDVSTANTIGAEAEITEVDKDGCLLFKLCYNDAIALGESSDTIELKTEGDMTTYTFTEHVLSCGTHMNGVITEEKNGTRSHVVGNFTVSNNSYQIDKLTADVEAEDNSFTSGTININCKELDFMKLYSA